MDGHHVPAWKKLGLKLKYAKDEAPPPTPSANGMNGTRQAENQKSSIKEPPRKKRRFSDSDDTAHSPPLPEANRSVKKSKEPRKLKKSVSFTTDTKTTDGDTARAAIPSNVPIPLPYTNGTGTSATDDAPPSPPRKKVKRKSKSLQPTKASNSKPVAGLLYLAEFYQNKSAWKFNKNREVWILKHAFSESDIPPSYNFALACYLYNLQSTGARKRLIDECQKVRDAEKTEEQRVVDEVERYDFIENIKIFLSDPTDFVKEAKVEWAQNQKRTDVIWWTLNALDSLPSSPSTKSISKDDPIAKRSKPAEALEASITAVGHSTRGSTRRKKKSRTMVDDVSSSSSSPSESESNDDGDESIKDSEDDTSSSGSASSSSSGSEYDSP